MMPPRRRYTVDMRHGLIATVSLLLLVPAAALAQQSLDGSIGSADPFTVSVSPQYPVPGGQAILSFLSATLDLNNATLTVSVGGKQLYQGSIQPVTVPLGKTGTITTIALTIATDGTQYNKLITIQPQDVSLIAEPIATAPVLYQGKPLVPLEGNVRVVAVATLRDANGKTVDPSTLSYAWTVDGAQIANSSGIGKTTIMVASPLRYRERPVSVVVQSQTGNLAGGASLSLVPGDPLVRIYENDPLLGIRYDHALSGSYSVRGTESSLYAAPFSLPKVGGKTLLQWFLNGSAAQTGSTITLRPTGTGQGSASLSLTASSGTSEVATADLSLSFGAAAKSNFFGL